MTFAQEVEEVLHGAFVAARNAGHASVTPEHIALEIIARSEAADYLGRCGTDLVAVESRLGAQLRRAPLLSNPNRETEANAAFQRIIGRAIGRTKADHREYTVLRDLFIALLDERGSVASAAFFDATRDAAVFDDLRTYRSEEEPDAA